jgi:Ca2+/H+ antiporter, TMEM165/GDT1 family
MVDTGTVVAFLTVFAVIAGFEFGDRTNFALIGLAAREPPLPVWTGAAAAFAATTTLSVAIGTALLTALGGQVEYLRLAGGILLLAYAGYLVVHGEETEKEPTGRSAGVTAFVMIFLLELGDTTMILTMNFVFSIANPVLVGVAAAAGLALVAATACLIGSRLGARVEPRRLHQVVIVILTIVGAVTILYALFPGAFPAL